MEDKPRKIAILLAEMAEEKGYTEQARKQYRGAARSHNYGYLLTEIEKVTAELRDLVASAKTDKDLEHVEELMKFNTEMFLIRDRCYGYWLIATTQEQKELQNAESNQSREEEA